MLNQSITPIRYGTAAQPSSPIARRGGFTLMETVMSTFLVSIVLVGSLKMVGGSLQARNIQAQHRGGASLARDLMAEIVHARYEEPDDPPVFGRESSESGGDRADWDDIDDYDGWSSSPPESKDGTELTGYTGWTREVEVR